MTINFVIDDPWATILFVLLGAWGVLQIVISGCEIVRLWYERKLRKLKESEGDE